MKDQSRVLILLIIILSLLNLWLLYTNQLRQNHINGLVKLQNESSQMGQELQNWGFEKAGSKSAKIVHPEVELPENGISMRVFFTDNGCGYCVDHEVEILNEFSSKFEGEFKAYLLSHNESFLKRLHNAEFLYQTIDPQEKLLNNDFEFGNPVAVFIDKKGVVQIIHIAEKDKEGKSNHFYKRSESLLFSLNLKR